MRGGKAQRLRIDVDQPFDGGPRTRNGQLQHVGRALAHDQQNNNHSKKAQKAGAVQPVIQYGKNNYGNRIRRQVADFFAELGTKYRTQLRKKEKTFGERLGTAFVLREYRLPDEVRPFLNAASAINRKTYQFRLFGESVDNDEASVASGHRAALRGAFRSFILWHGDIPLCFILGHQRSDGLYEHRQTGYDPAWRDLAPGIVCNLMMLRHLYAVDRPVLLDFGSGDADYKRLFSNESCMTANPVLVPRKPRYLLAVGVFRLFDTTNALAVRTLQKLGIKEWIKRQLRRGT